MNHKTILDFISEGGYQNVYDEREKSSFFVCMLFDFGDGAEHAELGLLGFGKQAGGNAGERSPGSGQRGT